MKKKLPNNNYLNLLEILQEKMRSSDISIKSLERFTGYHIVSLIRMINGESKMPAETLFTLLTIFNIKFKIEI